MRFMSKGRVNLMLSPFFQTRFILAYVPGTILILEFFSLIFICAPSAHSGIRKRISNGSLLHSSREIAMSPSYGYFVSCFSFSIEPSLNVVFSLFPPYKLMATPFSDLLYAQPDTCAMVRTRLGGQQKQSK